MDCHFVGVCACNISPLWNKVYTTTKYVSEFRKSFHRNRDVKALYMAPTLLFINVSRGLNIWPNTQLYKLDEVHISYYTYLYA